MPHGPTRLLAPFVALATVLGLGLPVLVSGTPALAAAATDAPLSGRIATTDGTPIDGATITLHDLDRDGQVVATATSDATGQYAVEDAPEGVFHVLATPRKDDPDLLASAVAEVTLAGGDEVVDLVLEVSNVRGVVRRSDGSPAAGASIESDSNLLRALTYDDGSYRVRLPGGAAQLNATPPAVNPDLDVVTMRDIQVAGEVTAGDITLSQPRLRGRVLAPDGETAIVGARVQLLRSNGRPIRGAVMDSRADGSYGFNAPNGSFEVQVDPPEINPDGWVGQRIPVAIGDDHTPQSPVVFDILIEGPTLVGVVRAPNGDPVPRARVSVWDSVANSYDLYRADSTGRYGVSVPLGQVSIQVASPVPTSRYLDSHVEFDVPHVPFERDLTLQRPNVTGRVMTADGLPVRGARIRTFGPKDGSEHTGATTDRDGRFGLLLARGTSQRLVADPLGTVLDGIRTARVIDVPAEGHLDDLEVVLDRAPVPTFDLLPVEAEIDGAPVIRAEQPSMSRDGSVVAFRARTEVCPCGDESADLPSDDPSNPSGEFVGIVLHDRASGEDTALKAPNGVVIDPDGTIALDDDGSTVAFRSSQNGLVSGDNDDSSDLFVLDRDSGTLTRFEPPADGGFEISSDLELSGDGRRLAAPVGGRRGAEDFFYSVAVLSLGANGAETSRRLLDENEADISFGLSRDGGTLAWTEWHPVGSTDGAWRLHVLDLDAWVEDPVRPFSTGVDQWNGRVSRPSLSDDGNVIAYGDVRLFPLSGSNDIWTQQVKVADRAAGTVRSLDPFDVVAEPRMAEIDRFRLSGDGAELLVMSPGGLPEEDDSQAWLVSVADATSVLVSQNARGGSAADGVSEIAASSDFASLALETSSADLSGTAERFVVLGLSENAPPTWPSGASVSAAPADIGVTSVRLQWSEATDNVRVAGYRVFRDGQLVGTTDDSTRQLRVTGLSADTSYSFSVQAVDGRFGVSNDGPSTTVRTLPEDTTELRPLDLESGPGGVVDLAWERVSSADELILRTYLGDAQVDERVLPATASDAQETGLAASTAYSFQVFKRSGEVVSPHTVRASVTTPALTFTALTWTVPMVRADLAQRGSTATVSGTAEPGRAVSVAVEHLSWYDEQHELLDEPRAVTSVVPLTEDAATPGKYAGQFELVDGISRIVRLVGTVADGHGGTLERVSGRAGVRVSNRVVATVDAPDGALAGGRLQLASDASGQTVSEPIVGGEVFAYDELHSADDYVAQVRNDRGRTAAKQESIRVRDGLATTLTLTPRLPARLVVGVTGPAGADLDGTRVVLTDAETGDHLDQSWLSGDQVEFRDVQSGDRVKVQVRHTGKQQLREVDPTVLTLTRGDNRLDVAVEPAPTAELAGVIRYADGKVAGGARLELRQQHVGEEVVHRTTADAEGRYELNVLRRSGSLTATTGSRRGSATVDLSDGSVDQDVEVRGLESYTVGLRLFVQPHGAPTETGPVSVDWRTVIHYGMTFTVNGRTFDSVMNARSADESAYTLMAGEIGQVVRWCIDGREAQVRTTCVEHTLTADRSPVIEMHAGPRRDAAVNFQDAQGEWTTGVTTDLYQVSDEGRVLLEHKQHKGTIARLPVPEPGTYLVEASKGDLVASKAFTVAPGDAEVDLGTLQLRARTHFTGPGNAVTAGRTVVLPGGDLELRAAWYNRGPALEAATARITVPTNTELVTGSVILNGKSVTPQAGVGYVDVALGGVPRDWDGILRYRLRALPNAEALPGQVEIRYGASQAEPLAPVAVPVIGVSVTGPTVSDTPRVPLNGRAPAGHTVRISDGGVPIGTTVAGPGGVWSTTVTLAEQLGSEDRHEIVAEATVEGEKHFARHIVTLDASQVQVEKVTIFQRDSSQSSGRRVTFDPREGVARFPFVFVPNDPLVVEVTVDEPQLVTRLHVVIGTKRIEATRRDDDVFVASYASNNIAGDIAVDINGLDKPIALTGPEAPERVIRDGVPGPFQGFQISDIVQPDPSGSGPRVGGFMMSVPAAADGSIRSTMTVSRETYVPTAEDIEIQRESGSPVYDLSVTESGSVLTLNAVVPVSELGQMAARAEADGSPMGRALARALRDTAESEPMLSGPVSTGISAARIGYRAAFNSTTTLATIESGLGGGGKYEKLEQIADAASDCGPIMSGAYVKVAQGIARRAMIYDVVSATISIAAIALAPATFGLGTMALGLLSYAIDKGLSAKIEHETEDLRRSMEEGKFCEDEDDEDEEDDDDRRPPRPVGKPVWIHDPSGYVYEGARSMRLSGVTATLLTGETENGPWEVWDAAWFEQTNPQTTDNNGRYGWDVPEGWWKVAYTKEGYRPAHSRALKVLPPHTDVDVSLVKDGFPHVTGSAIEDGRLDVTFDRLVRSGTATRAVSVVDDDGNDVPGAWSAIGDTTGDEDRALQQGLRFTPASEQPAGTELTVQVDGVADYEGRLMAEPYTATFTVPDVEGPDAKVPDAPASVRASAGERDARVSWAAPHDNGAALVDYVVTASPGGKQVTVGADKTSVDIEGLTAGTPYMFTVAARNAVGTGPASAPSNEVVPTSVAPETSLTTAPSGIVLSRKAVVGWSATGASYVCKLDSRSTWCGGTSTRLRGLRAGTHVFSVAARDADGDVDATPAITRWTVPRDDRSLAAGKAWRALRGAGMFDGTYLETKTRGATLTARVENASRLSLVVARGRRHGTVTVYVGKDRIRTLRLDSRSAKRQQVMPLGAFAKPRSGKVRVVVTSRKGVVRVDGLVVETR